MKRFATTFIYSLISISICISQSIFTNPITGINPNTSNPYTIGQVVDANITASGIGRGTGIVGSNANDRYNANNWNTVAIDQTAYFEFTLTPNSGYLIDFTSFVYTGQASGTGPTSFAFRSSLDSYTANIGTPTAAGATIDLTAFIDISTAITFRLYGWNASASGGTFSVNDFTFNGSVTSSCTAPTQATNFSAINISTTQMDIGWTGGNGDNVLVLAKAGSAVDADPTNGTSYNANAAFGNGDEIGMGNYVVYNGSGTSVTVTNLMPDATYYYAIYEYNDLDVCYNLTELTGDGTTLGIPCSEPANQPTVLNLTPSYNSISGVFTGAVGTPNANGYLVLRSTSPNPGCLPTDGTTYIIGQSIGSCSVVYVGENTNFNSIGLSSSTTYYFFIFSYNNSTGTVECPNYLTNSPLQGSATTLTSPNVFINEVDSDTPGQDEYEFVELSGTPNISLFGLVLVFYNGSNDQSYYSLDLDGYYLNSNGYFLVGNSAVVPNPDVIFGGNTLQNGADAVALYIGNGTDFPNLTPVTSTNLLSALVYGTDDPDDTGLIDGLNQQSVGQINEDGADNTDGHSNQLFGGTWVQAPPTPGASNALLPIELYDFYYVKSKQSIKLLWSTASETNNSHFSIEKSADGRTFHEIGQVAGQGTSYQENSYEYVDETPYPSLNYYRLKQVDFDGAFSYSPVKSVDFQAKGKMGIFPNPFRDETTLTFTEESELGRKILLFDQTGRLLQTMELKGGELSTDLKTDNFLPGTYILKVQSGQQVEMHRLMKL